MASRFTKRIRFASYNPAELGDIGRLIAKTRDSELTEGAYDELVAACNVLYDNQSVDDTGALRREIDLVGNGRFVRNVIESAEEEREYRLSEREDVDVEDLDETELMRIELGDMRAALENVLGMTTGQLISRTR